MTVKPVWVTQLPVSALVALASNHHVSALPRAAGVQAGVTDVVTAGLAPCTFAAVTATVYATSFARPVSEQVVAGAVEAHDTVV